MICSLMVDSNDCADFPDNEGAALGRPLAAYPLMAAKSTRHVGRHFVVTDSPAVKAVALQYGAAIIDPPAGPASPNRLLHGCRAIREELKADSEALELLVVLHAHSPAVAVEAIEAGIEALQARPELDSAASVSAYNRFNPYFARREAAGGLLEPYVPFAATPPAEVWYPDWGVCVIRPRCLEATLGPEPFSWLGRKVLALKQWGGGPIDHRWQLPGLEIWLKKNGATDSSAGLEPQPKPQPAPKKGRR